MRANEKERDRRKTMTERKSDERQKVKKRSIKLTAQSIKEVGISGRDGSTSAGKVPTFWLCSSNTQHIARKARFCC
jgi:hypothetical protein